MTGFTKGPWEAGRSDMASIVDGVDSKWIYAGNDYVAVASGRVTGSWDTVMSNAHLISSAPELYEALEDILPLVTPEFEESPMVAFAKASLAKARGES